MKGTETPELSKKWWAKNKPMTLTKTGLGDALLAYEIAVAKKDDRKVLDTISGVKRAVANAVSKADSKRHAETIKVLKKYPKIIESQITLAEARIQKDSAASSAPPKQKFGKEITIWERDISDLVKKKYNPEWLDKFNGCKLKLTLNNDILDVLEAEDDLVTPAFMVEDAQGIGDRLVDEIVKHIKKIDDASAGKPPQVVAKAQSTLAPFVKKAMADAGKELSAVPKKRWEKFAAKHAQYRDYQIKAGLKVTVGVLGTAGAAAGIVGSGGAGLALGVVALVRSVAGVAQQLWDLYQEADQVGKELAKDCQILMDRYRDANGKAKKGKQAAAELGGSALKGILGTDATPFLATLPNAKRNYALWDNKVAGVVVAGRKASKVISEALQKTGQLEKKLQKSEGKKAKEIYKKLTKIQQSLDHSLNKTSDLMGKVRHFEQNGPKLKQVLNLLENQNSDFAKIFDKVFPAAVNLALSGASAGVGIHDAKSALDDAKNALNLVGDIEKEGVKVLEEVLA